MITEIGLHKVQCKDIMHGIDDLMCNDKVDFLTICRKQFFHKCQVSNL